MTVRAFKKEGGTQGTFTKISRMMWPDRHLYKKKQQKQQNLATKILNTDPPLSHKTLEPNCLCFPTPK